jgi:hypothetical protein
VHKFIAATITLVSTANGFKEPGRRIVARLCRDIGIMDELIIDGAAKQTGGPKCEFMKTVRFLKIKLKRTEPYSP